MQGNDRDAAGAPRGDTHHGREAYTRRIDCAPSPRRPEVEPAVAPHVGHGSGSRAPGEEA
ncbi:MAG TPA: hypothetical protein VLK84_32275 [Longimicrobium sp.]|nr:hypothetical protein [Longimicrobium sp.]